MAVLCLWYTNMAAHGPVHEDITRLTKLIAKRPTDYNLYVSRGGFYKLDGDFDKSYADYQTAKNIKQNLPAIDFLLAELFYTFDFHHSALASVNAFQKQKINKAECYLLKAKIFDKLFESDSALHYAEAAYPYLSKVSTHYFITTKGYALFADKNDYKTATYWMQEGKKKRPYDLVIQEEYINLALQFKDFDTAEKLCLEKLPTLRRKEYWQYILGNIYTHKGDNTAALAQYTAAIQSINKLPKHHKSTAYIAKLNKDIKTKQEQLKL